MLATTLYKSLFMKNTCKMASMLKKISLSGDISIMKWCFVTNSSIFILHHDLIALKIECVVSMYELINYEIIFLLLGYVISSTSDLQPSIAIWNQYLASQFHTNLLNSRFNLL